MPLCCQVLKEGRKTALVRYILQGTHQVVQKSSTTVLPRSSERPELAVEVAQGEVGDGLAYHFIG